jgi:hypothetical protein
MEKIEKKTRKFKEMENGRKGYVNNEKVSKKSKKKIQKNARKREGGDR